ncbi:MAG: hypothetical protein M3N68_03350, partial [Actinomycetota bacterium]|nr:hypothetical protein [Actinomycetota bacterium]
MAPRILAFLAAVAMVVGAVAVRDRLEGGDGEPATEAMLRLVCSNELAAACERLDEQEDGLEVTIEAAGETAGRLAAARPGTGTTVDGWLVAGPWPAIVEETRRSGGMEPLLSTGAVLARSPTVLAVFPTRAEVLRRNCEGEAIAWRCLGDVAGRGTWAAVGGRPEWGPVKVIVDDPSSEADGLAVLGAATAAFFQRADVASNDLDDAYRAWLAGLARAVPSGPVSLEQGLAAGPALLDAYAGLEAEAAPLVATSAQPDKPLLIYPSPVATADVVLGSVPGPRSRRLAELVASRAGRMALATTGWRVPGQPRAAGVPATPALPAESGLPRPGALA